MTQKQRQLCYTIEAMTELKSRLGKDGAEAEWARNALKLDTLSEDQLRAIEWLANNVDVASAHLKNLPKQS